MWWKALGNSIKDDSYAHRVPEKDTTEQKYPALEWSRLACAPGNKTDTRGFLAVRFPRSPTRGDGCGVSWWSLFCGAATAAGAVTEARRATSARRVVEDRESGGEGCLAIGVGHRLGDAVDGAVHLEADRL